MHINTNNSISSSLIGVKGSGSINGSLPKASIYSIRYYDFCFLSISLTKPFNNALIASLDEDKKSNFQKYHRLTTIYQSDFSLYSLARGRFKKFVQSDFLITTSNQN